MSKIVELFGHDVSLVPPEEWKEIIQEQTCIYTNTKCFKVRKSQPEISVGTCTVNYGKQEHNIIICPKRLLQKRQVFTDCIHLLTKHEPGNEFHVVSEISIPGGSIDYFLVSPRDNKVQDFVGIEFQTLDTTGTVFPKRQRLLKSFGIDVEEKDVISKKKFGMNWKMTAKTILIQLHHKVDTFEHSGKNLVLIVQDYFLDYMKKEFNFSHLSQPSRLGDSMHIHSYSLDKENANFKLKLSERLSTDSQGISTCMGLQADAKVEFARIITNIEAKLSDDTLLTLG